MKTPTSFDAIDISWLWTADEDLYWQGDHLTFDIPEDMSAEELFEWEHGRSYQPLREHTALFIEFSQTPTTRAGILKFANAYGMLDSGVRLGMPRQKWVEAITEMRDAVAVWRAIEGDKNAENLRSASKRLFARLRHIEFEQIAETKPLAELLEECKRRLQTFVNNRLREHATTAQLVLTKNGDFQLTFRPKNLLGAMWLQFAQAMAHNYSIKICRGCGRPFQTGAGTTRRADATTCKDSCRQEAYRKEQNGKQQRVYARH